jgi:hypothetical protein
MACFNQPQEALDDRSGHAVSFEVYQRWHTRFSEMDDRRPLCIEDEIVREQTWGSVN